MKRATKPITGGTDGYPVPELGEAHILRSLLDAGRKGEHPHIIHWKDGWTFCEDRGVVFNIEQAWDEMLRDCESEYSSWQQLHTYDDTHHFAIAYMRGGEYENA